MKVGQYCQRQRCKHVKLEQFLACFRVARVCQLQLGFLVTVNVVFLDPCNVLLERKNHYREKKLVSEVKTGRVCAGCDEYHSEMTVLCCINPAL